MVSWLPAGNQTAGLLEYKVRDTPPLHTPTPLGVIGTGVRYCIYSPDISLLRYPSFSACILIAHWQGDYIVLFYVNTHVTVFS
jgi:hypothetical protein